jgi:hypothetical protein
MPLAQNGLAPSTAAMERKAEQLGLTGSKQSFVCS